jgi:molecular chaperone GrpE
MATTGNAATPRYGSEADEPAQRVSSRETPATGEAADVGADAGPRPQPASAPAGADEGPDPKLAELEDRWRRAVADLDNLRKRCARELERERENERARVTAAWLPMLDNLELALGHATADPAAVVQGVRAIRDQAVEILAELGYPRQNETGVPFDPNRHEVVSVVDEPQVPAGVVTHVFRPGYGHVDRQLRPTAVAVNKPQE